MPSVMQQDRPVKRCVECFKFKVDGVDYRSGFVCSECRDRILYLQDVKLKQSPPVKSQSKPMNTTTQATTANGSKPATSAIATSKPDLITALAEATPEDWAIVAQQLENRITELQGQLSQAKERLRFARMAAGIKVQVSQKVRHSKSEPPTPASSEQKQQIYKLADSGKTVEEIARVVCIRPRQVQMVLARRKHA